MNAYYVLLKLAKLAASDGIGGAGDGAGRGVDGGGQGAVDQQAALPGRGQLAAAEARRLRG